jgi:hypothetical protein
VVSIRIRYITGVTIKRQIFLQIARKEEPTSGLEPLTPAHYECAVSGCWELHTRAIPAYLSHFLFPGLLCVAPYCIRGGQRIAMKLTRMHTTNLCPMVRSSASE